MLENFSVKKTGETQGTGLLLRKGKPVYTIIELYY